MTARASAEPPERTEGSSPGALPAAAMHRQDRSDSPSLQRPVSHPKSSFGGCGRGVSAGRYAVLYLDLALWKCNLLGCHSRCRQASWLTVTLAAGLRGPCTCAAPVFQTWCLSVQGGVITRSQHSRAQQEGCQEALLGGFSPPMRRRAASNEGDSQQQGSTLSDRASKTAGAVSGRACLAALQGSAAP